MVDPKRLLADLHVAAPPDTSGWQTATSALDRALQGYPGHRLFTILAIDWARNENQRVYSSAPESYPCGGAKPLVPTSEFYQEVILGGRARICIDREACRRAFPDYALIEALGCECALNVPVRRGGATIGSLNLLHVGGWYDPEMLSPLMLFADYASALLVRRSFGVQA
ncbi:GAF domain-containing protein [Variovorax sp. S2]|uniref:GAF domain-containing protein n=1 Tax=Variovorax sp. S12S4 TaxID=3029170 RepID=UPI00215D122C|nr:GAF domain-containing protein [Variovorax sp. S12S4]MCR8959766.1 GAF domain-containing protein [Variovorax sp. S12S4]